MRNQNSKPINLFQVFFITLITFIYCFIAIKSLSNSTDIKVAALQIEKNSKEIDVLTKEMFDIQEQILRTITTLNSENLLDNQLQSKAQKFTILQTLEIIKKKLRNGIDAKKEVELLEKITSYEKAKLASELALIYTSQLPPNTFFINAIEQLVFGKKSLSPLQDQSFFNSILEKFVKVENINHMSDRDGLISALRHIENNNMEIALEIIRPLCQKYIILNELIEYLQLRANVNTLIFKIKEMVFLND